MPVRIGLLLVCAVEFLAASLDCAIGQESPYAQTVLRDKPVIYLRFEQPVESFDKSIRDTVGQHSGAVAGKLLDGDGVPGIGGRSAIFDGHTSVITIPHAATLKFDSLSVEFWFRSKQAFDDTFWPGSATLISKATPGAGTSDWTINAASSTRGHDQGRLLAQSGPHGKSSDLLLFSPVGRRLNDDRWHHLVWTRADDGSNRMYLNGELAAQGNDGGGAISNERSIQIGGDTVHEGARHFAGQMDEVAIYNKPMPLERVRAHFVSATIAGKLPPAATRKVDFVSDVQPIFRRRCFECHGPGKEEGGLSLASRASAFEGGDNGAVLVAGTSVVSRLVHLVAGVHEDRTMPPDGKSLSADEIGLLRAWIDQGANWPPSADIVDPRTKQAAQHWSFQPITSPELPETRKSAWVLNPVDAFVLQKLLDVGLEPAPAADPATLLRRASFDVTGLPPVPADIQAFLEAEDSDGAYLQTIEDLLESPHYGERWGRHWLDVVRYADSAGFELDSFYHHAWQYRDYVIRSFNTNKPFDRFIIEQLAADELWPDDEELRFATGLLTVGPYRYEGGIARPEVARYERLTDVADTIGTALLGVTIGCARCHSHKYDPISQKDYFGLHAILAPGELWDVEREKRIDNSPERKKPQTWVVKNVDTAPMIHLLRRGELSAPRAVARPATIRFLPGGGPFEERRATDVQNRRTRFARWVVSRDNPLTARVLANRVWQWHFGQSLVPTPDDFGLRGEPPTHPKLLDYLASELVDNNWKLKRLHRLIMSSNTYRMASRGSRDARSRDPDNHLLSRFPRRRLEAEIIWDNLHAVSGTLNRDQFGPPVVPPIEQSALDAVLNTKWDVTKDRRQWTRRGMYVVVRRSLRVPFFETFNTANPIRSCVRRETPVVSPQALTLLNGAVAGTEARAFAGRLLRECGDDPATLIERSWLLAFGRVVARAELQRTLGFLTARQKALEDRSANDLAQPLNAPNDVGRRGFRAAVVELCLALMNTNEFIYID